MHILNLSSIRHAGLAFVALLLAVAARAQGDARITPENVARLVEIRALAGHTDAAADLAFSPDGALLVSVGDDTGVRVWSTADGAPLGEYYEHGSFVKAVAFNPTNPRQFATGGWDGVVLLWALDDAGAATVTARIADPLYAGVVEALSFAPDGEALFYGVGDGSARLVDVATSETTLRLSLDALRVEAVAISPPLIDGRGLLVTAAGFPDTGAALWDRASGEALGRLDMTGDVPVTALAFDLTGGALATGGADGSITLWQALDAAEAGYAERLTLAGDAWISDLAFTPDGRLLVTALDDGALHFWETAEGRDLAAINARGGPVHAVAVNAAGTQIASAHDDGVVRLWGLAE
jgi:WD40 repeat protein